MAKNTTAPEAEVNVIPPISEMEEEPKVHVTIHSDKENQDDVLIGINGQNFSIQRDVEVEIPLSWYRVLIQSEKMERIAIAYERKAQHASKEAIKAL